MTVNGCEHKWFHHDCVICVSGVMSSTPNGQHIAESVMSIGTGTGPAAEEKKKRLAIIKHRCIHLGKRIPPGPGCGCGTAPAYNCRVHGKCGLFDGGPLKLNTCLGCEDRTTRTQIKPEPSVGVVIGTYGFPNLAELQVLLIRKHCGDVPILLCDDCSDGTSMSPLAQTNFGRLSALSRKYANLTIWSNPVRLGHAGGDLTSYFVGLQWAKAMGIDVLAKLSQRCLLDASKWLQEGANSLWEAGVSTSSQKCREGTSFFSIRSEAMLMAVESWAIPEILDHLRPRPLSVVEGKWGVAAENVLWDSIQDRLDGQIHGWTLFGENRMVKYDNMIWHCSHSKEDYQAIFDREGVEMDEDFTCKGWVTLPGYKG